MSDVLLLFSWQSDSGDECAIFLINDTDEEEARVEWARYNSDEEMWKTVGQLDTLSKITDYSIPNSFLDDSD